MSAVKKWQERIDALGCYGYGSTFYIGDAARMLARDAEITEYRALAAAAAQVAPLTVAGDERAGFEAWFMRSRSMAVAPARAENWPDPDRDYVGTAVECCWQGWQARAALSAPVARAGAHGSAGNAVFGAKSGVQPLGKGDHGGAEPAQAGNAESLLSGINRTLIGLRDGWADRNDAAEAIAHIAEVKAILAAAPQDRAARATVPDGWCLVPTELTEAMQHAAEDVPAPRPFGAVYRAMLAAAPATPRSAP